MRFWCEYIWSFGNISSLSLFCFHCFKVPPSSSCCCYVVLCVFVMDGMCIFGGSSNGIWEEMFGWLIVNLRSIKRATVFVLCDCCCFCLIFYIHTNQKRLSYVSVRPSVCLFSTCAYCFMNYLWQCLFSCGHPANQPPIDRFIHPLTCARAQCLTNRTRDSFALEKL